jgi:intergrase/recombinase
VFNSRPAHYDGCGAHWFNSDQADSEKIADWKQFHNFLLQRMSYNTAEDRLRYAKQYGRVLETGNAAGLLSLQPDKRIHAMKALSNLAKFTGKYDVWLQLRQRYNLKWSTGTEKLDAFERFFDDNKTLDTMLQWLRQVRQELPKSYSNFFVFCTLTGLRASECVACIRLIKGPESFKTYYNEGRQCLEHFRFAKVFIRRTKAAYISLVDKEILEIAQNCTNNPPSYNALKKALRHRSLDMQLKYCRKIYASYLRQNGIESEVVDLLQGRVPKSVFARHYFTPSLTYRDRVLECLYKLKQEIET